jgi:molybdopterin adenylyltransferase
MVNAKNGLAHADDHEHHAPDELHVGILTCSDRSARGERADTTGPTIHNLVVDLLKGQVVQYKVVPDNVEAISQTLVEWADEHQLDLILTNGGSGLSPTDVTPEATRAVIQRETPWIVSGMVLESLRVTPYAMLTRATAGIRGQTLIVNLPGSPKAATENLTAVAEILPHAVMIVQGVDPALVRGQKKGDSKSPPAKSAPVPAAAGAVAKNVGGPTC